jgi:hypothetical protein
VVGLTLCTTAVLLGWLPCTGTTTGAPPVVALAVGDWLGLDGGKLAGGGGAVGGGATGAAVVGAVTGTGTGTGIDDT